MLSLFSRCNDYKVKTMKNRLIGYLLVSIFSISIYAQSNVFRGLSGAEGLSDLVIGALYKDSCGYLWIGTATSVERFDGVHLKHYPIYASSERMKWVNAIVETTGNQLWVGTDGGFWQIGQDRVERVAPEIIKNGVRSVIKDNQNTLYIGSETGLHILKDGKIETILLDTNIFSSANFIIGLYLKGEILWLITKNGLYSMGLDNRQITHYVNNLVESEADFSYRNITCIDSTLYLGTMEHGLLSFDMHTRKFQHYLSLGCNVIRALSCDGKDILYVGTDGNGVHFVSTKKNKVVRSFCYDPENGKGLRSNSVYSLLVDREGIIWVGLCQLGLDYTVYQSGLFSVYSTPYFTSKDIPIRTIYIGKDEKLIGSRNGLFYINENENCVTRFTSPQLRSSIIACSYVLQGKVYIGTYGGGMYVFDLHTKEIRDFAPEQPIPFVNGHIFCMNADKDDNLWIGTSAGIYRYKDGKQMKHFSSSNSHLPEGNIYVIYFDSTHKGWICTEKGICIWDPLSDSIKRTGVFPDEFVHEEKICGMYEDSKHELYFLPYKGNIFISDLSMERFRRVQPNTLLEGKDAMFVIEDKQGWLWIGTNNGLYRYDKEDTFIPYNFADGIPSPVFLACAPVIDEDGSIWFGNARGLISLPADWENKKYKLDYSTVISAIRANGEQIDAPIIKNKDGIYEVSLDASQNNVTICFSGLVFTNPDYMSYECRMEGVDKSWKVLTGKSEMTFYDLSSGNYTFKVRRAGDAGSETCLHIHLSSPVSLKTVGIILLSIMLLLSFAYYAWMKKKEKMKTAISGGVEMLNRQEDADLLIEEKYKTSNFSVEECKDLFEKLEKVMRENKPYTNPDLKIADLSSIMGVSSNTLSYLFNQYLKQNYYNYINDYRIAEFKRLVSKGEHAKYTLNALMESCGFSSRTSFFRYFKKANGITPAEYIKLQEDAKI